MQLLPARAACNHEVRVFENAQMLHYTEARHLQLAFELRQRAAVTDEEQVEQEASRRVSQRLENTVLVVHRWNICDLIVTCQGFDPDRGRPLTAATMAGLN